MCPEYFLLHFLKHYLNMGKNWNSKEWKMGKIHRTSLFIFQKYGKFWSILQNTYKRPVGVRQSIVMKNLHCEMWPLLCWHSREHVFKITQQETDFENQTTISHTGKKLGPHSGSSPVSSTFESFESYGSWIFDQIQQEETQYQF